MEAIRKDGVPSGDELAKRLFHSPSEKLHQDKISPRESPDPREPLRGHSDIWKYSYKSSREQGPGIKRRPKMGFCGAIVFFFLCSIAVALTFQFNTGKWNSVTTEGVFCQIS